MIPFSAQHRHKPTEEDNGKLQKKGKKQGKYL